MVTEAVTKKAIGARIRIIRLRLRLTQAQFAQRLSCSISSLSGYEIGDVFPPLDILIAIVQAGNVTYQWLFTGQNVEQDLLEQEDELLAAYRSLDDKNRDAVLTVTKSAAHTLA